MKLVRFTDNLIHYRIFERVWGARSLCHGERRVIGESLTTSPNRDKVTCPHCLKLLEVPS